MYDEFERAVGGDTRRGLSPLAWLGVGLAAFTFVMIGLGFAGFFLVKDRVEEAVAAFEDRPEAAALERLEALDPEVARAMAASLSDAMSGGAGAAPELRALQDVVEGSLRIRGRDGDVSVDLSGDERGGALVIEADGERVELRLVRTDVGGTLVVRSREGEFRVGAGDDARPVPSWVPTPAGMPDRPTRLYSAESEDGAAGAVAWETVRTPDAVAEEIEAWLDRRGFEVAGQASVAGDGERARAVWGRHPADGRSLFVVAGVDGGGSTSVLMGYGQRP